MMGKMDSLRNDYLHNSEVKRGLDDVDKSLSKLRKRIADAKQQRKDEFTSSESGKLQ